MMIIAFVCTYFLGVSAMIVILVCLGIGLLDLLVSVLKKRNIKRRSDNAFTEIIFFIYTSRSVQCRWRLCRNSAYSGTNSKHTPPYDYGGIFSDLITVAEMTPGPISINSSTFVGMRIAGIGGVLLCSLGCIIPVICHMLYTRVFLL